MGKILNAACTICGNVSGYDKQSLRSSTYKANGYKVVLCLTCEDDLLKEMLAVRGLTHKRIRMIADCLMSEEANDILTLIPEE